MRTYLMFNNLGKVIRDAGFDLTYIAGVCGVSKSSMGRYCNGDSIPNMEVALKICDATGYGFYDIWGKPYEAIRKKFYVPEKIGYKIQSRYHNNLEYFRNMKGFSVNFLAFRCGISYRSMNRYLRRETIPNVADAIVLATALETTVYDLFEKDYLNV